MKNWDPYSYSSSFVNLGYGTPWKLEFGGVDLLVNTAKAMIKVVGDDREVTIELSDGSWLKGTLHPSLTVDTARSLVGRTLDLSNAYRQLVNSPASDWCAVIAISNPNTNEIELDIQHANPFGATACVYSFNRFAKAIWWIGVVTFGLIWTNHFDDYPQLDLAVMGNKSQDTAERLMTILGWGISMKESKRIPFDIRFSHLGVVVDLCDSCKGMITVKTRRAG